jgi:chromosomal replication initiation ATPase DnaA
MSLTAHEAWSRLLDRARQELPEQTYRTWLEPTEALSLSETTIFVGCPDQFAADWNESKHADMLASLAPIALGHPLSVVFKVTEERRARSQMDLFIAQPPQRPIARQGGGINSPPLIERTRGGGGSCCRPSARQGLQPALHLRRHRTRQDPPHAGDCA